MQIIDLYRYEDKGTVVITPTPRAETDTPSRMRLIADENTMLTDGTTETEVIDVMLDEVDKWTEIGGAEEATEADYIFTLNEKDKIIDILSGEGE